MGITWEELDNYAIASMNHATATITDDYEKRKEVTEPHRYRAAARLAVTLLVAALLVAAVIVVARNQPHRKQVKKECDIIDDDDDDDDIKDPLKCIQLLKDLLVEREPLKWNEAGPTCPCKNSIVAAIDIVRLYVITELAGKLNETPLSRARSLPNICNWTTTHEKWLICRAVVTNLIDDALANPIPTSFLLPMWDVFAIALTTIETHLERLSEELQLFQLKSSNEEANNYSSFLLTLLGSMVNQSADSFENAADALPEPGGSKYLLNDSYWNPSKEDYWNASRRYLKDNNITAAPSYNISIAFGMSISWSHYDRACSPDYCELTESIPVISRILSAIGIVGGFFSITLIIVRGFLWPCLVAIFFKHATKTNQSVTL